MKKQKETERALAGLEKFLAKSGIDTAKIEEAKTTIHDSRDAVTLQGEAVLLSVEKPARFTMKRCKQCGEPFGTNYRYVAHCGTTCLAKSLRSQSGMYFDPNKSLEERIGGELPLLIPPTMVKKMVEWATHILTEYDLVDVPVRVVAGVQFRDFSKVQIPPEFLAPVQTPEELEELFGPTDRSQPSENTTPVESLPPVIEEESEDLSLTENLFGF